MDSLRNLATPRLPGVGTVPESQPDSAAPSAPVGPGASFADVLAAANSVTLSRHAAKRIEQRGIELEPGASARLGRAMDELSANGSRTAAVLIDQAGFVIDVPSRTIKTAISSGPGRGVLLTDIDSVYIG